MKNYLNCSLFVMIVFVAAFLSGAWPVQAWQPNDWEHLGAWPAVYSLDTNEVGWFYVNATNSVWIYSFKDGRWSSLDQNPEVAGWNYFTWPYFISTISTSWYYFDQSQTTPCYSWNSNAWSQLGESTVLLSDHFDGSNVSSNRWHIPTWVSPNDGTYLGRTQLRCSQNAALPPVINGEALIALDTYNPTGASFYGTDLISNQAFAPGSGLIFTIRAKMSADMPPGMVCGIFLYAPPASGTNHDEIDFEILSNDPNHISTNIYGHEPLGVGHPVICSYPSGAATDYHEYQIVWKPTEVTWSVDGAIIRTVTAPSSIPTRPMYAHLNVWVPGAEWANAYSATLNYTTKPSANRTYYMIVDSVTISK